MSDGPAGADVDATAGIDGEGGNMERRGEVEGFGPSDEDGFCPDFGFAAGGGDGRDLDVGRIGGQAGAGVDEVVGDAAVAGSPAAAKGGGGGEGVGDGAFPGGIAGRVFDGETPAGEAWSFFAEAADIAAGVDHGGRAAGGREVFGGEVGGPALDDATEVELTFAQAPPVRGVFDGGARVGWGERARGAAGDLAEGSVVAGGGECGEDERIEEAVGGGPCLEGERDDRIEPRVGDGFAAIEAGDEAVFEEAGEARFLLLEEESGLEEWEEGPVAGDDDEVDVGIHGAEGFVLFHVFALGVGA